MSNAGHSLGKALGEMTEHKFASKPAGIVAKIGQIVGMALLVIAVFVALFDSDGELALVWVIGGIGAVVTLVGTHWIALQLDKKYAPKKPEELR